MQDEPTKRQGRYLSFLLRLWRENGGDRPFWRASLQRPQTERRLSFATMNDLFDFLEHEVGLDSPSRLPAEEGGRHAQESDE
jgi:hypothetical protein